MKKIINKSIYSLDSKGFTLVELLIVIAIIGILASIIFTSLSSAREKANRASAMSTMSSIMAEMSMCAIDGGGTDGYVAGAIICTDGASLPVTGHTSVWPDIFPRTGWNIIALTSPALDDTYTYSASKGGQTITCSLKQNSCQ